MPLLLFGLQHVPLQLGHEGTVVPIPVQLVLFQPGHYFPMLVLAQHHLILHHLFITRAPHYTRLLLQVLQLQLNLLLPGPHLLLSHFLLAYLRLVHELLHRLPLPGNVEIAHSDQCVDLL